VVSSTRRRSPDGALHAEAATQWLCENQGEIASPWLVPVEQQEIAPVARPCISRLGARHETDLLELLPGLDVALRTQVFEFRRIRGPIASTAPFQLFTQMILLLHFN
jgi:hypothetical protein